MSFADDRRSWRVFSGRSGARIFCVLTDRKISSTSARRTFAALSLTPATASILLPVYGDPADQQAIAALAAVSGERAVVPINCRTPIEEFGSLHCLTMQLPEGALSHA